MNHVQMVLRFAEAAHASGDIPLAQAIMSDFASKPTETIEKVKNMYALSRGIIEKYPSVRQAIKQSATKEGKNAITKLGWQGLKKIITKGGPWGFALEGINEVVQDETYIR